MLTENGVTIIGYTDLAGRLPTQASQLYGTNLVKPPQLLTPKKTATSYSISTTSCRRSHRGPRRRDHVATTTGTGIRRPAPAATATPAVQQTKEPMTMGRRLGITFGAAALLFGLIALSPPHFRCT